MLIMTFCGGNLKYEGLLMWSSNSISRYVSEKNQNTNSGSCIHVHRSTIYNSQDWKQLKFPLANEWVKKMWHIDTTEYYSSIKKNKILPFTTTWTDLECIKLSETSQTRQDKYYMISLICGSWKQNKPIDTETRLVVAEAGEWVKWVTRVERYKLPAVK